MDQHSTRLDEQLRRFEAVVDKSDPEQVKLLEEMREHTRRLHQARGNWNKPSTDRCWNDPTPAEQSTAPLAIESYKQYKQHKLQDETPLLQITGSTPPSQLAPP